jgi:hypothetical protein
MGGQAIHWESNIGHNRVIKAILRHLPTVKSLAWGNASPGRVLPVHRAAGLNPDMSPGVGHHQGQEMDLRRNFSIGKANTNIKRRASLRDGVRTCREKKGLPNGAADAKMNGLTFCYPGAISTLPSDEGQTHSNPLPFRALGSRCSRLL